MGRRSRSHSTRRRHRNRSSEKRKPRRSLSSDRDRDDSRDRERRRRAAQMKCMRQGMPAQDRTLFWDGFQWVAKNCNAVSFDQKLNSTRKARRLYIGNIPIQMGVTETSFQNFIYQAMKERGFCVDPDKNPVVCAWFAKEKNYGFVEFATVEETERAMLLDGTPCRGIPLKISRPNDYTQSNAGVVSTTPEAALQQIAAAGGNVPGLTNYAMQGIPMMPGMIPPPPLLLDPAAKVYIYIYIYI
eukprot:GHVL01034926.1.p1 GENE.GHVL01034926.1~~GHVL01034926.1.p1  ORF type:complete len:243 (-),score=41.82 GHVL01034926.1:41-769(-)